MSDCRFTRGQRVIIESTTLESLTGYWGHVVKVGRHFDDQRGHFVLVVAQGHRDGRVQLPTDLGFGDNVITLFERELAPVD